MNPAKNIYGSVRVLDPATPLPGKLIILVLQPVAKKTYRFLQGAVNQQGTFNEHARPVMKMDSCSGIDGKGLERVHQHRVINEIWLVVYPSPGFKDFAVDKVNILSERDHVNILQVAPRHKNHGILHYHRIVEVVGVEGHLNENEYAVVGRNLQVFDLPGDAPVDIEAKTVACVAGQPDAPDGKRLAVPVIHPEILCSGTDRGKYGVKKNGISRELQLGIRVHHGILLAGKKYNQQHGAGKDQVLKLHVVFPGSINVC